MGLYSSWNRQLHGPEMFSICISTNSMRDSITSLWRYKSKFGCLYLILSHWFWLLGDQICVSLMNFFDEGLCLYVFRTIGGHMLRKYLCPTVHHPPRGQMMQRSPNSCIEERETQADFNVESAAGVCGVLSMSCGLSILSRYPRHGRHPGIGSVFLSARMIVNFLHCKCDLIDVTCSFFTCFYPFSSHSN